MNTTQKPVKAPYYTIENGAHLYRNARIRKVDSVAGGRRSQQYWNFKLYGEDGTLKYESYASTLKSAVAEIDYLLDA